MSFPFTFAPWRKNKQWWHCREWQNNGLPMFLFTNIYINANLFIDVKKNETLVHLRPSLPFYGVKIFNTSGEERHGSHSKNDSRTIIIIIFFITHLTSLALNKHIPLRIYKTTSAKPESVFSPLGNKSTPLRKKVQLKVCQSQSFFLRAKSFKNSDFQAGPFCYIPTFSYSLTK